jgi:hypothetical protein
MVLSKIYEPVPERIEVIEWPTAPDTTDVADQNLYRESIRKAAVWITARGGEVKMVGSFYQLKSTSLGWVTLVGGSLIAHWLRGAAFEVFDHHRLHRDWRESPTSPQALRDIILGAGDFAAESDAPVRKEGDGKTSFADLPANPPTSAELEALKREYQELIEMLPASMEEMKVNLESMRRERKAMEELKRDLTRSHQLFYPEVGSITLQGICCVLCYAQKDADADWRDNAKPAVFVTGGHAVCAEHVDEVIEEP